MQRIVPRINRLFVAAALIVAFVMMASIITPEPSPAMVPSVLPDVGVASVDPHAGAALLGELEGPRYRVLMLATDDGPRYSVYATEDDAEMGVMMTAEQVSERFADLKLPEVDFSAPEIMVAEPDVP